MNYNIISEYVNYSKQCINNYFKKIFSDKYNQGIVNNFVNAYIDARYYEKTNNLQLNIRNKLSEILKDYSGKDIELANNIFKTFNFIMYLDNVTDADSTIEVINAINYFKEKVLLIKEDKNFVNDFFELVKRDLIKKKEYLDNINDKKFDFETNLTTYENVYDVIINQNLKFPEIYNSIVINRVFNSKEMSNKRSSIEYTYTALKILKDMIRGKYYEYMVNYPSGISNKKNSIDSLFGILDHDILKERVIIKINFEDFINEKDNLYNYMRVGYTFAVIIINDFEENKNNLELLKLFRYIIIKRKNRFEIINEYQNIIVID